MSRNETSFSSVRWKYSFWAKWVCRKALLTHKYYLKLWTWILSLRWPRKLSSDLPWNIQETLLYVLKLQVVILWQHTQISQKKYTLLVASDEKYDFFLKAFLNCIHKQTWQSFLKGNDSIFKLMPVTVMSTQNLYGIWSAER